MMKISLAEGIAESSLGSLRSEIVDSELFKLGVGWCFYNACWSRRGVSSRNDWLLVDFIWMSGWRNKRVPI